MQVTKKELIGNLEAAKAKLAAPGGWIKGAYARNACGSQAHFGLLRSDDTDAATCFCAMGAVWSMRPDVRNDTVECIPEVKYLKEAAELISGDEDVPLFNDDTSTSKLDVLELYDLAITLVKADDDVADE